MLFLERKIAETAHYYSRAKQCCEVTHDSKFAAEIVDKLIASPYGFNANKLVETAIEISGKLKQPQCKCLYFLQLLL